MLNRRSRCRRGGRRHSPAFALSVAFAVKRSCRTWNCSFNTKLNGQTADVLRVGGVLPSTHCVHVCACDGAGVIQLWCRYPAWLLFLRQLRRIVRNSTHWARDCSACSAEPRKACAPFGDVPLDTVFASLNFAHIHSASPSIPKGISTKDRFTHLACSEHVINRYKT